MLGSIATSTMFLLKKVREPTYILSILSLACLFILTAIIFNDYGLVLKIISDRASLLFLMKFFSDLVINFFSEQGLIKSILFTSNALLFGVNSLLLYLLFQEKKRLRTTGMTFTLAGVTSIFLGVGCVACGTFITYVLASFVGFTWTLALFPLGGGIELYILSFILLVVSIVIASNQLFLPKICPIPNSNSRRKV